MAEEVSGIPQESAAASSPISSATSHDHTLTVSTATINNKITASDSSIHVSDETHFYGFPAQKRLKIHHFCIKDKCEDPSLLETCEDVSQEKKSERCQNQNEVVMDTILQDRANKASPVCEEETSNCLEFSPALREELFDRVTMQESCLLLESDSCDRATFDAGNGGCPVHKTQQEQCDRSNRSSGITFHVNNHHFNESEQLPEHILSEPVTFEEARRALMTALAYLEANHILPGTTFKFLKKRR